MFAFALESQSEPPRRPAALAGSKRSKPATNLTVHERFVLKAETLFPGSEVLSHQSYSK